MEHLFIIISTHFHIHICDSSKTTIYGDTDIRDKNDPTITQRYYCYCYGRKRRKKHEGIIVIVIIIIITKL